MARKFERKIMATRSFTTYNYKYESVVAPCFPQPTQTPQQLEEKMAKEITIVVITNTLNVISVLRINYFI